MHPAALPDDALLGDCEATRGRRGGPGGQHRNKVETAVRLLHRPTGTVAEASERRSQAQNQGQALFRLRVKLAVGVRADWAESSGLWRQRSRGGRVAVNVKHTDYPAVLAESLDALAATEWDVGDTAYRLGVTATQLVKLWRTEPAALGLVNDQRAALGMRALR